MTACSLARDAERAHGVAAVHLDDFSKFDAWARRALGSAPAFRDDSLLEETAFAPLRHQHEAVAGWLERKGTRLSLLAHPHAVRMPVDLRWTPLKYPQVGTVDVALAPIAVKIGQQGLTSVPCVLISRSGTDRSGTVMIVTAAYRTEGSALGNRP